MTTDKKQMIADEKQGLYSGLTYDIIGALYEVHKELGAVHKENIYQEAVAIELKLRNLPFEREKTLPVKFKGQKIGAYRPDFIVDEKVILELKAVPAVTKEMLDQIYYYIRGTKYSLVLLANFGTPKLTIKRRIYTK